MAISYPLTSAAFWETLRFANRPEFALQHYRKQSQDGAGNTLSASLGTPKWSVAVVLEGGWHNRNLTQEADIKHLEGRDGTFLAYDIRRPYPEFDPTGTILDNGSALEIGAVAASGSLPSNTYAVEGAAATITNAVTVASSAGTRVNASGLIESILANALRVDYDPITHAVRGILAEAAFTNVVTYSEQLDNAAWTKMRTTVTANATTAPDGTTTADKVVESVTAGASYIAQTFTAAGSQAYVGGAFVKAAEKNLVRVQLTDTGGIVSGADVSVNLTTGAITGGAGTVTDFGNGWYRISVTGTPAAGSATLRVQLIGTELDDGTSGMYVWGAQVETGSTLHTYVATTSAAVARVADALTFKASGRNDWTVTFDNDATQAFNDDSGDFTPTASGLTRPRIKAWSAIRDQQIVASVQVKSKGSNNRSLALKGLPKYFRITKSDKLSILYSSTKRFLFEAMETVTADINGETTEFEIQPFIPAGVAVNDAVTLKKAPAKFKILAGSYRPASGRGNLSDGVSFSIISAP